VFLSVSNPGVFFPGRVKRSTNPPPGLAPPPSSASAAETCSAKLQTHQQSPNSAQSSLPQTISKELSSPATSSTCTPASSLVLSSSSPPPSSPLIQSSNGIELTIEELDLPPGFPLSSPPTATDSTPTHTSRSFSVLSSTSSPPDLSVLSQKKTGLLSTMLLDLEDLEDLEYLKDLPENPPPFSFNPPTESPEGPAPFPSPFISPFSEPLSPGPTIETLQQKITQLSQFLTTAIQNSNHLQIQLDIQQQTTDVHFQVIDTHNRGVAAHYQQIISDISTKNEALLKEKEKLQKENNKLANSVENLDNRKKNDAKKFKSLQIDFKELQEKNTKLQKKNTHSPVTPSTCTPVSSLPSSSNSSPSFQPTSDPTPSPLSLPSSSNDIENNVEEKLAEFRKLCKEQSNIIELLHQQNTMLSQSLTEKESTTSQLQYEITNLGIAAEKRHHFTTLVPID
jgi:hypothetical protein